MFLHVSTVCSSLLNVMPLYRGTTVCLSIYLLMDIWVVSSFSTLKYKLFMNIHEEIFNGQRFSFLLSECLGLIWLGHVVCVT